MSLFKVRIVQTLKNLVPSHQILDPPGSQAMRAKRVREGIGVVRPFVVT